MNNQKKYKAKILLFGEHAVIKGSDALAIPFPKYAGKWVYTQQLESAHIRQMDLPQFLVYLKEKSGSLDYFEVNTTAFAKALSDGLYFQSNIPLGYGAGSSGALCAAVYDQFVENKSTDPVHLKKIFSLMESFFHGSSSGFDPITSYLDQAIKISHGIMTPLEQITGAKGLFLIDTGIKRNASAFINIFMEKCEDAAFEENIKTTLVPLTTKAIASYLNNDSISLFHQMHDISRFQYLQFNEMIPDNMMHFWEKSLRSNFFKMKLCGAGGGGFMLGITKDFEKVQNLFRDIEVVEL